MRERECYLTPTICYTLFAKTRAFRTGRHTKSTDELPADEVVFEAVMASTHFTLPKN